MIEKVCNERDRPYTWFYDSERKLYFREDQHKQLNGTITGDNLPNPDDIFEMRNKAREKGYLPIDARVHADPVTITLWEDWQRRKKCQT